MSKILTTSIVALAVLGGVGVGASYFGAQKAQESYDRFLQNLTDVKGISVENKSYERGLFSSKGSFEFKISPIIITDLFKLPIEFNEEDLKKTANFKVDTEIKTGLMALINGYETHSTISVTNEELKNPLEKIYGSNVIATADANIPVAGTRKVALNFKDASFSENNENAKLSGFVIKTELVEHDVKSINMQIKELSFKDEYVEFAIANLDGTIDSKNPLSYEEIKDFYTLKPASYEYKIGDIRIKDEENNFKFSQISGNGVGDYADTQKKLYKSDDVFNIKSIDIASMDLEPTVFKDIVLKTYMDNLDISAYKALNTIYQEQVVQGLEDLVADGYSEQLTKALGDLFASKLIFNIKEFSIKNDKDKKLALSLNFNVDNYDKNKDITENISGFRMDGEFKSDGKISEFLHQFPEAVLLDGFNLLKADGNGYKMTFKFLPEEMDILINNETKASEFGF